MDNKQKSMDKIVALCKGRGFIFPGSEIYGGLANTWDYGPLGEPLQRGLGRRHFDESPGLGGLRPRGRLFRSPDGLQGVP